MKKQKQKKTSVSLYTDERFYRIGQYKSSRNKMKKYNNNNNIISIYTSLPPACQTQMKQQAELRRKKLTMLQKNFV